MAQITVMATQTNRPQQSTGTTRASARMTPRPLSAGDLSTAFVEAEMNDTKHTQTPRHVTGHNPPTPRALDPAAQCSMDAFVACGIPEASAYTIARKVHAHDELVAALRHCIRALEQKRDPRKLEATGTYTQSETEQSALIEARAALAKVAL